VNTSLGSPFRRRRNKIVIPVSDALDVREKPKGVFLRDSLRADRIQPRVCRRYGRKCQCVLIKWRDGIAAKVGKRFGDLRGARR